MRRSYKVLSQGREDIASSAAKARRLGSGLIQHQKAMTVASATAEAKLAASLS